jgi:PTS system N-acetylgalactosamine-specific IIA component
MSSSAVRAIVAGHGDFAAGLVSAVSLIAGRGDHLLAMTNRGLGAEDIERALRERVAAEGIEVIFTDLPAGSWTIAARRLQRERAELVLATGTNLPMLLDFVFHEDLPPREAAQHAVDKGRAGIALAGVPSAG